MQSTLPPERVTFGVVSFINVSTEQCSDKTAGKIWEESRHQATVLITLDFLIETVWKTSETNSYKNRFYSSSKLIILKATIT